MKLLNGLELAEFIKERQLHSVRNLKQEYRIFPKLAIITTIDNPIINVYINLKKKYGADIGVIVDVYDIDTSEAPDIIARLNSDEGIHGIIVQLPLSDTALTEDITSLIAKEKDVDALNPSSIFDSATATAILWLLAGYNINLAGQNILIIGQGKLVGTPLTKMLKNSELSVDTADKETTNLTEKCLAADLIITATGDPGIIKPEMIKQGAIVVDAGVASEGGKSHGDLSDDVYERDDLTLTPQKGGVGPLTVCALFDNVLRSARLKIPKN